MTGPVQQATTALAQLSPAIARRSEIQRLMEGIEREVTRATARLVENQVPQATPTNRIFQWLQDSLGNILFKRLSAIVGPFFAFWIFYFFRKKSTSSLLLEQENTRQQLELNQKRQEELRQFQGVAKTIVLLEGLFREQQPTLGQILAQARELTQEDRIAIEKLTQAEKNVDMQRIDAGLALLQSEIRLVFRYQNETLFSRAQAMQNLQNAQQNFMLANETLEDSRKRLKEAVQEAQRLANEYEKAGLQQEDGLNVLLEKAKNLP